MSYAEKYISFFIFTVFFITVFFFCGIANKSGNSVVHASFLDTIKAFVTINPLAVEISAPSEVELGRVFSIEAKVINKGEVKIENINGEIFLPEGLSLRGRNAVQKIKVIQGGKEKKIFWQVAAEYSGNYIITVSAFGELKGNIITAAGSKVLTVEEKEDGGKGNDEIHPPRRRYYILENFFNFMRLWFGQ
jgi:hypothetical protein